MCSTWFVLPLVGQESTEDFPIVLVPGYPEQDILQTEKAPHSFVSTMTLLSSLLPSILELFRILGPTQTIIWLIAIAATIWFRIGVSRALSPNPRHHTDEYVKSHMWEFIPGLYRTPMTKPTMKGCCQETNDLSCPMDTDSIRHLPHFAEGAAAKYVTY